MTDAHGCLCCLEPKGQCPEHPHPPIVFLDVDGVLNSDEWYEHWETVEEFDAALRAVDDWRIQHLDPAAVARLRGLVLDTGARIVVSSAWRYGNGVPRLMDLLEQRGFPEARGLTIGETPQRHRQPRADEIGEWLDQRFDRGSRPRFVILDDDESARLIGHFVKTIFAHGLTDEKVAEARAILEAP